LPKSDGRGKAFQAPIQPSGGGGGSEVEGNIGGPSQVISERVILNPIGERTDVIEGPFIAEQDAVVGEIRALEGFELPQGQVPENLITNTQGVGQQSVVGRPPVGDYWTYRGAWVPIGTFGPSGGGGGGYTYCFSADSRVRTPNGLMKRMDELAVGDWILSTDGDKMLYSPVVFWSVTSAGLAMKCICILVSLGSIASPTAWLTSSESNWMTERY